MKKGLTQHLRNKAVLYYSVFFLLALIAFWPGYFSIVNDPRVPGHVHFHGISMTLWCICLIVQASLIRLGKTRWHKTIGKFSIAIVIMVLMSGFHIAHVTVSRIPSGTNAYYSSVALMFNSLILFAILYFLAIWNRKKIASHTRYMICSIIPLFTPITDRLTYMHFRNLLEYIPQSDGRPVVNLVGFGIGILILLFFLYWDWVKGRKKRTLISILLLVLIYNSSVLFFYKFSFWRKTAEAIMSLPLS